MKLLRSIHRALVAVPVTRKFERRLTRGVKGLFGVSDAYGDLFEIIRERQPAAVLDVGSFHGETIVRFADETAIPIHGFEPTQESFDFLTNRFRGHPHVSLHHLALSHQTGETKLFRNANPQTNSLLDNDAENQTTFIDQTFHVGEETVKTSTLDDWMNDVLPTGKVVIKSDVQGGEGLLLDGGPKSLRERVLALYSEAQLAPMYEGQCDFFQLHQRLTEEFGFVLANIYPCYRNATGHAVQTDALWIHP